MVLNVLLVIYGCLTLVDITFMLILHFFHDRRGYYKTAMWIWVGVFLAFVADGAIASKYHDLNHIFGIPFISITTFGLAKLSADIYKFRLPFKRLAYFSAITWLTGTILHFAFNVGFVISSLVICIGIVAPGLMAAREFFKSWKSLNIIDRLFGFSMLAQALHILDYPFLRQLDSASVIGFSLGLFLVYTGSMLFPVVINRRLSADLNEILEEKVKERTNQLLQTEAMLVHSARTSALGEMAGGIAHEINTPLATISLLTDQVKELLEEEPLQKKTVSEMLEMVNQTLAKINKIVRSMLMFSRRSSDQDRAIPIPVKEILENTLIFCQDKIRGYGIDIQINQFPENCKFLCRADQAAQVFFNVFSNACDAVSTLQEKWIRFSVETDNNHLRVLITDSGKGLPKEVKERLFQPFFTTKKIGKGTGLGLSVSKGIMETFGGSIMFDAACENTRFILTFRLPAENSTTDKKTA